eukprot:TRINITY_DN5217_c0_g1_i6.p2 TRINITY_DN5217_c0_g1~~TRINITY_DN5217_c0_g1_i6.p2  ORF type:complete len:153 (-),score=38.67 TRINITY_DN5217_c0_g1_i6:514-972(-)
MKNQLIKERELLEQEIQRENGNEGIGKRANSVMRVGVRHKFGRTHKLPIEPSKQNLIEYKIGVPVFLTKAKDNLIWKDVPNSKIESTMMSAVKRYETSLEKAERAALISKHDAKERAENLTELMKLEATKRRLNEMNTRKFLELQMQENVLA